MKKSRNKAELKSFSKEKLRKPDIIFFILIFFISYLVKCFLFTRFAFTYDELAYSATAQNLARNGGWFDLSSSKNLFFFPPLFNWLSGLLVVSGVERVIAVRTVTMFFSSAIPAIMFLILRKYGLTPLKALTGPILWIMMPGVLFYSTVGQVETPFLLFVLLSVYLFQFDRNLKNTLLSAFFLSCGIWIKETAIGFAPVFLLVLTIEKDWKKLSQWTGALAFFCLPLFIRSAFSQEYGLFYELYNDLISWGNISFLSPFRNILSLIGFFSVTSWIDIAAVILCLFSVIGINIYALIKKDSTLVRILVVSNLVFLIFFTVFPKKFDYYILGILLFTLILTAIIFAGNRVIMSLVAITLTVLSIQGLKHRGSNWDRYFEAINLIKKVALEDPGATIGTTFPETVRYIAETNGLNIKTADIPFTGPHKHVCRNDKHRCITKYDYFFTDELFFVVLFCKTWPIEKENCDIKAMKKTFQKLEKVGNSQYFNLYRIVKSEEQIP